MRMTGTLAVGVAGSATQAAVRTPQREAGLSMVEDGLLERDSRGMARGALISTLPAVRIRMTGGTARILEQVALSLFIWQGVGRRMAGRAIADPGVQSGQWKTRLVMGKLFQVPVDQFKIFALVLRVAGDAAVLPVSVPAAPGLDPFRQVAVAGQALQRIGLFFHGVACGAIGDTRQMRMGLAELPRRNQQVDFLAAQRNSRKGNAERGRQHREKQPKICRAFFQHPAFTAICSIHNS